MWIETTNRGTYKLCERYTDPQTGKKRKTSVTIESNSRAAKKIAEEMLLKKIEDLVAAGESADALTLGQLKDYYIESQKETVRKQTWFRNEYTLDHALAIIGEDIPVDILSAKGIVTRLKQSGKPHSTLNGYIMRLKAMLRWGYENEYLDNINFVDRIKPFPDHEKVEKLQDKYLESDELDKLLETMKDSRWKLLTQFLALSGLRIGEAMVLNDSDIDKQYIYVTKTYQFVDNVVEEGVKTDTSNREVFIQPELEKCIREIRSFRKTDMLRRGYRSSLFIPWKDGTVLSYDAYRIYLCRCSAKIGHAITPHALRHTHVSLLAEKGVPLDVISRRVGHADSDITRRIYLHITEKRRDMDNKALENVVLLG